MMISSKSTYQYWGGNGHWTRAKFLAMTKRSPKPCNVGDDQRDPHQAVEVDVQASLRFLETPGGD
jgi:hypothetical protein